MPHEAKVWVRLKRLLSGPAVTHLERVECVIPPGLPDVHYIINEVPGWIELKDVDRPKRPTTPIRIDHFTKRQRLWLYRYGMSRGHAWILVHVEDVNYLFDWRYCWVLGDLTEDELMEECALWWTDKGSWIFFKPLADTLCSGVVDPPAKGTKAPFKI